MKRSAKQWVLTNRRWLWPPLLLVMVLWHSTPLLGADMRELSVQARKTREALKEQAKAERAAAMQAAAESRARIAEDRAALEKAVAELEAENRGLEADIQDLTDTLAGLAEAEETVGRKLAETDSTVQELVGVIRVTAKDIDALIEQNPRTALTEAPAGFLEAVAEANRFPGMAEIRAMAEGLWRQSAT